MNEKKEFPENMKPLGNEPFPFSCHSGLDCYMTCCRNVDMYLFPYDILRMKQCIGIDSEQFMRQYTRFGQGPHPYFPAIMLKLDEQSKACPFLGEDGCTIYKDRPSSCRTYPLERAVDRDQSSASKGEFYFLTNHSYCHGHQAETTFTVKEWVRNQWIHDYNTMNDLWAQVDTFFATNPWKGEGAGGPKQQMAFMVCYNIDGFRRFSEQHNLLAQYRLAKDWKRRIANEDSELLKFGFEWLKLMMGGRSSLSPR